ncbi:DUF1194 domain-containing protein, partial [Mesorhizobium sp.]|uniref:DUF1194 domain-containing protein n=1 Tax=Mesorhizobium sp. TaxID=1871066 RepID=UPI0025F4CC59
VQPSRQNAIAKGYTINAIAIPPHDKEPKQPLATYFARSVIGGSQAFVISPTGPRDYTAALRRKLVIEVSMNALSRHPVDDGTRKAINWDRDADAVFCHASASYRGDSDLMVDLDAPFRHARSLARPMASTGRVVAGDKAGPMPLLDVACAGPDRRGIRYASDGWQCHMCTY